MVLFSKNVRVYASSKPRFKRIIIKNTIERGDSKGSFNVQVDCHMPK